MSSMVLTLKDAETDRLAQELAAMTGESITEAVQIAIIERHSRVLARRESEVSRHELRELMERARGLPVVDPRTQDEILGYDENGIPD